jgi:hypothetical protein
MKRVAGICLLWLCGCLALAQHGHRDPTPQDRDVNPDRQLATQQIDPAQLSKDANELAQLANSVPTEIENVKHGVVAKDLDKKLKRIEKLSKRLRSELSLD